MKRIFLLLAIVGMTAFQSCSDDDTADQRDTDTIAEVFEINQNTTFSPANNYTIDYTLNPSIYNSDMILVYRLSGTSGGNDVWESLPKTYYFSDGSELEYTFDFTINDIQIRLDGTNLAGVPANFTNNQVFRVLIIPAYDSGASARMANTVDLSDYNAVVKAYGLNDSNIKSIETRK